MTLQHLGLGRRSVLGVEHVRPAQEHRPGGHVLVVGDQQAPLPGVHVLEGLGGEATSHPEGAGGSTLPPGPHGVGAVLHQHQAEGVGDLAEGIHVGHVSAHVRQQQDPGTGSLGGGRQVVQVDPVVRGGANEHRCATGVDHRPGHRGQGEGVHQHRLTGFDADGHQRRGQRRPATVEGHAVPATHQVGELGFEAGHVGFPGTGLAVAEQATRRHQLVGPPDPGVGDRRLVGEVQVDPGQVTGSGLLGRRCNPQVGGPGVALHPLQSADPGGYRPVGRGGLWRHLLPGELLDEPVDVQPTAVPGGPSRREDVVGATGLVTEGDVGSLAEEERAVVP